jgi:hypothetical protein
MEEGFLKSRIDALRVKHSIDTSEWETRHIGFLIDIIEKLEKSPDPYVTLPPLKHTVISSLRALGLSVEQQSPFTVIVSLQQ